MGCNDELPAEAYRRDSVLYVVQPVRYDVT